MFKHITFKAEALPQLFKFLVQSTLNCPKTRKASLPAKNGSQTWKSSKIIMKYSSNFSKASTNTKNNVQNTKGLSQPITNWNRMLKLKLKFYAFTDSKFDSVSKPFKMFTINFVQTRNSQRAQILSKSHGSSQEQANFTQISLKI